VQSPTLSLFTLREKNFHAFLFQWDGQYYCYPHDYLNPNEPPEPSSQIAQFT